MEKFNDLYWLFVLFKTNNISLSLVLLYDVTTKDSPTPLLHGNKHVFFLLNAGKPTGKTGNSRKQQIIHRIRLQNLLETSFSHNRSQE